MASIEATHFAAGRKTGPPPTTGFLRKPFADVMPKDIHDYIEPPPDFEEAPTLKKMEPSLLRRQSDLRAFCRC